MTNSIFNANIFKVFRSKWRRAFAVCVLYVMHPKVLKNVKKKWRWRRKFIIFAWHIGWMIDFLKARSSKQHLVRCVSQEIRETIFLSRAVIHSNKRLWHSTWYFFLMSARSYHINVLTHADQTDISFTLRKNDLI